MLDTLDGDPPALLFRDPRPSLRKRLVDAPGVLLCLDYDGTLTPIVADPDDAEMSPETRSVLRRLGAHPAVEVAVVSGRSLDDLRDRVDVEEVHLAGNHGLELDTDGECTGMENQTVLPEAQSLRPAVERAVTELRSAVADVPGTEVEDKGLTASVHYRRTPKEQVESVEEGVVETVSGTDSLRLTRGKQVLELRPDIAFGKDTAVRCLRERHPEYLPVFVGDDVTDEDAFEELPSEGIAVRVGERDDTAASLRVRDPEEVAEFLRWVLHTLDESTELDS